MAIAAPILGGSFGTALSVVGTVFSAISSISQARSAQDQANFNAQVARNNAIAARQAAEAEAAEIREATRRRIGSQRARLAAGGVVTTEGSALLAQIEQAAEGELDAQKRLFSGELQASGQETQAQIDTFSGQQARASGTAKAVGTILGAGTSLLR